MRALQSCTAVAFGTMLVKDALHSCLLFSFLFEGSAWVMPKGPAPRWAAGRLFSSELNGPLASELPDSFDAAVEGAISSTLAAATDG